jgi:hypothetical protein
MNPTGPLEVFFSFAHKDKQLRDELETHLSVMKQKQVIETWHDREIAAGEKWAGEIDEHLNSAQIILLLISPDFVASDYCYGKEMTRAQERAAKGEAQLIPVILRPGEYQDASFLEYQCLPEHGKPVTLWSNRDEAFANVATGIRKAVDKLIYRIQEQQKAELEKMGVKGGLVWRLMEKAAAEMHVETQSDIPQMTQMEQWKVLRDVQKMVLMTSNAPLPPELGKK